MNKLKSGDRVKILPRGGNAFSAPDASPVEMLKFFIEDRNTNQRTVALGSGIAISTMSEILSGPAADESGAYSETRRVLQNRRQRRVAGSDGHLSVANSSIALNCRGFEV